MNITHLKDAIDRIVPYKQYGKVLRVVGLMIESIGPDANIGEVCYIYTNKQDKPILAEVVGFSERKLILMPYSEVAEIGPGCLVEASGKPLTVQVGKSLIGKVVDAIGQRLDGKPLNSEQLSGVVTERMPPNPLTRPPIDQQIQVGIKAIDSLLAVGRGQRVGIFAGSGVGKSTLLGMIARNGNADINVIALVGERGREVREFVENDLGKEGLKKSVIVAATSDQPALMRIKGAFTATAISEYFRDRGYHVNLLMDSVTRVAMAQREIGLAVGEPPTTKGYTPSVFATLPKLLERTGTSSKGTITAFYTVLVDGDDMNEPIADAVRGILDGHFILDRKLAEQGQYPAINILQSVSRLMNQIVTNDHLQVAQNIRQLLATYEENRELIQIGAYKQGSNQLIDQSIAYYPKIQQFLYQDIDEYHTAEQSIEQLKSLLNRGG